MISSNYPVCGFGLNFDFVRSGLHSPWWMGNDLGRHTTHLSLRVGLSDAREQVRHGPIQTQPNATYRILCTFKKGISMHAQEMVQGLDPSSTWIGIGKVVRENGIKTSIKLHVMSFDPELVKRTGENSISLVPELFDPEAISGAHKPLELYFGVPEATRDEGYVCVWAPTEDSADSRVMKRIYAK